jgi:hypothetical protein
MIPDMLPESMVNEVDYNELRAAAEKLQEALTQSRVLEEQTFRNNADLRAENEALRKDAGRYRWLRDGNAYVPEEQCIVGGEPLDQCIDAAMQASGRTALDESKKE